MAKRTTRKQTRYGWLREHHLSPAEARAFSVLPKGTPALQAVIRDRDARWERFMHLASKKVFNGKWRETDIPKKWVVNLSRFYRRHDWLTKGVKVGNLPVSKGQPNPWAMYRSYEKDNPSPPGYMDWEKRQIKAGKTPFDRGQIFLRKKEIASRGKVRR